MEKKKPRIGVYVCHCGGNISDTVYVDQVAEYSEKLDDVVLVRSISHMCSEEGQKAIIEDINGEHLDRVVVAACSPQFQGETFKKAAAKAGLNPYMIEMANIREQSAWPHYEDRQKATDKAEVLTKMAVDRMREAQPAQPEKISIGKTVLVVGAGIAGIQASLDLADAGFDVHLVEKEPVIGGHMAQLSRTFPTNDCASCILSPKMADVVEHPGINLHRNSDILEVKGTVGNFQVKIRERPVYVDPVACTACNRCAEVCPVIVPSDNDLGLTLRKAIDMPSGIAVPHAYVLDDKACLGLEPLACGKCAEVCDVNAINYDHKPVELDVKADTIIVATGYDIFDARLKPQYGYGKFENVLNALELERILVHMGEGHMIKKIGKRIAFVQCVGSRDAQVGNLYCSRICCMYATKLAMLLKSMDMSRDIYVFYTDLRAYGKGFEEYYRRAQEMGIKFVRGRPGELQENPDNKKIILKVEDTLTRNLLEGEFDQVILSVGLTASKGTIEIAEMLKLPRGPDGFIQEAHAKFKPLDTAVEGIFIAGTAQGPKDIPDSVAQASGAAARAIRLMNRGEFELSPVKATINAQLCDGCEKCIDECPADAISIMGGVASVNTPACKGCGACISSCHTGAIDLQVFSNAKVMEEIEAALEGKKPEENRILLFADDMCTYRLADGVGTAKMKYSPDVLIIRVPSSSRVTPEMMAKAFELGADGIMLGECEAAVSPFPGTAEAIKKNVQILKSMLEKAGIETDRVLFSQYVTVMFSRFVNQTNMMSDMTRKFGPISEEHKKKLAGLVKEYKEAM